MSLIIQEQILLDLLFDQDLLKEFCQSGTQALDIYGLSKDELEDFKAMRVDALKLEAQMRQDLVLGQICKHLPLSMALMSSFDNGLDIVRSSLKPYLMSFTGYKRSSIFAKQLHRQIDDLSFFNHNDKELLESIISFEQKLAEQSIAVARAEDNIHKKAFSDEQALTWQSQVQLSLLPISYWQLKQALLDEAVEGRNLKYLWQYLQKDPVLIEQRVSLISMINPDSYRVLLSKPITKHDSISDPEVEVELLEFISAFAPLFNSVNSRHALNDILDKLRQQSDFKQSNEAVLDKIKKGFLQLYEKQFLLAVG